MFLLLFLLFGDERQEKQSRTVFAVSAKSALDFGDNKRYTKPVTHTLLGELFY